MLDGLLKKLKSIVPRGVSRAMDEEPARIAHSPETPKKLMEAVRWSYSKLESVRRNHRLYVSEYVGDMYGDGSRAPRSKVLVNKINQMVSTYMYLLSSGTPQCLVTTRFQHLRPFAHELEYVVNRQLREVHVEDALRRCVLNALFSVGVAKTGIADGDEMVEIDGQWYDPGTEFTTSIHPNDLVIDMQAESEEQLEYIGDRYMRPASYVKGLSRKKDSGEVREMRPEPRASGIQETEDMRIEKKVWLWDIFLPKHNLMMTFVEGQDVPLLKWEWDGPEGGPYDLLQFTPAPGEVLGVPPVAPVYHQHMAVNNLLRKILRQAEREKIVGVCAKGDEGDADILSKANDGDMIGMYNPDAVQEKKLGGPDLANHNLAMYFHDVFNAQAGNLDLLGGISPQSGTLGQDELLRQAANLRVAAYQDSVLKFFSRVMYRHAWYVWSMQFEDQMIEEKVAGVPAPFNIVRSRFTPEEREGDFLEYNFTINPHSLRKRTPSEVASQLLQMWTTVVLPSAEIAMQSGFMPNFEEFSKKISEMMDIPHDLLWKALTPTQQADMALAVKAPPRFRGALGRQEAQKAMVPETGMDTQAMVQANASVMADNRTRGAA